MSAAVRLVTAVTSVVVIAVAVQAGCIECIKSFFAGVALSVAVRIRVLGAGGAAVQEESTDTAPIVSASERSSVNIFLAKAMLL